MDPRFYDYYMAELLHLRESALEFAKEFPKAASRLSLEGMECPDPYVERLLEGFAFLTARVQLKLDAEYPNFIQNLTEIVYPNFLAPVPAMAVVRFEPNLADGALVKGVEIPRQTVLRSRIGGDMQTSCEFRTAHPVRLWPLEIADVRFGARPPELPRELGWRETSLGSLRIGLKLKGDLPLSALPLDSLAFFISADERVASRLYEHLLAYGQDVCVVPPARQGRPALLGRDALRAVGFGDAEALLPVPPLGFRGYRLLQEYAAFAPRFLFFELRGLSAVLKTCKAGEFEVLIPLAKADEDLQHLIDQGSLALYATPAVNLFPKEADRIFVDDSVAEFPVLADRTRPMDYEVHSVEGVTGYSAGNDASVEVFRLYASIEEAARSRGDMFYALRREKRAASARARQRGSRTSYVGTETFLSLVDTAAPPHATELKQLSVRCLCTNRDLPIMMPTGQPKGDFSLDVTLPVQRVQVLRGPSRPVPPALEGDAAWKLINHLSLNYLTLSDTSEEEGAAALRRLLGLYCPDAEAALSHQVRGIRSVRVSPVVRRLPDSAVVTFVRGHEIELTCDPKPFEGFSPFILAAVLEDFFSRHASVNAFGETVLRVIGKGEVKRWKPRIGRRPVL